VVRQQSKVTVRICITVIELHISAVGFETLQGFLVCDIAGKNTEENVIFHEVVDWSCIVDKTVYHDSKVDVCIIAVRLNQGVCFRSIIFLLQLE